MNIKKRIKKVKNRIPLEFGGIQVNFCKNPICENFGVPESEDTGKRRYRLSGGGSSTNVMICLSCGEHPPIKSNLGIKEELARIESDSSAKAEASCTSEECVNHNTPISCGKKHYQSFGLTASGSRRYRCKACHKTFSVGAPTQRQRFPEKNEIIFSLLMNKMPFNRICEVANIHPETLYQRIGFFSEQCKEVSNYFEEEFFSSNKVPKLYLSSDRQEYVINWTAQEDKRNVTLRAIGTADNVTSYVFGMHLDFDPNLDARLIEADAADINDRFQGPAFRKYARLWLQHDYVFGTQRKKKRNKSLQGSVEELVSDVYVDSQLRIDIEAPIAHDTDTQLPKKGMQIHSEYTMYAHFFYLKKLFRNAPKIRFFLDQDSGIRAACLGAFHNEISLRKADAFYVHINKHLTVNEKRHSVAESKADFNAMLSANPGKTPDEVKVLMMKSSLKNMCEIGKWKDRWLRHPLPNMGEPEKAICYLTDLSDYSENHLARLYNKASLHSIDRYFMQIRRRISLLERPISSSAGQKRMWYGYSAYNPEVVVKMLTIFRTFYNYHTAGKDKKTPAMRLGLTGRRLEINEIIKFIRPR